MVVELAIGVTLLFAIVAGLFFMMICAIPEGPQIEKLTSNVKSRIINGKDWRDYQFY